MPNRGGAMHSFLRRLVGLASAAGLVLLLLCAAASFTDHFRTPPSVDAYGEALKLVESRRKYYFDILEDAGLLGWQPSLIPVDAEQYSDDDDYFDDSTRFRSLVMKINRFRKRLNGNDEVSLNLNVTVDLRSAFTWNTKQVFLFVAAEYETLQNCFNQVSLWDHIIPDKDQAMFSMQPKNRYLLIDQGSHLLGKEIELVLHWFITPKTGRIFEDKMSLSHFRLPDVYM